ncbi:NUDIX domain protein [Cordyceps militaris CM01]|uniref:NUDIX domain protein n=1 Tax=Cordyceps militaris (strain CM01) TaxID=983644 RepID=G3J8F7_CORMM|nr:NUDIX domain protein [Cordyceps militaris CM01]EGX93946.1 NUDIX domain protein [Cordyceps militaris CM01]
MLAPTQNGDYTAAAPPVQDSTTAQVPSWLTAASAVAHTVRITHIPDHIIADRAPPPRAPDTGGQLDHHRPLADFDGACELASAYYDVAAMAPLNPFSKIQTNCIALHASCGVSISNFHLRSWGKQYTKSSLHRPVLFVKQQGCQDEAAYMCPCFSSWSLSLRTCTAPFPNKLSPDFGETPLVFFSSHTMFNPVLNNLCVRQAAINRLRAYKPPPFPLWDRLPVRMRAAVLILLYADRFGDLRVVITMRAAALRNFSGHAALPGGKADTTTETPCKSSWHTLSFFAADNIMTHTIPPTDQIARREAWEEIGLPMEDRKIPKPFRVEKLCYLPPFLARTHVVVTPCVAYLHADAPAPGQSSPVVEHTLVPKLDASEVAAVFTAPFYNFLKSRDLPPQPGHVLPPGHWYDGAWINWKDVAWRVHNFYVPVNNQQVSRPAEGSTAVEETKQDVDFEGRFKVWGMTGRVLVDAARIAYGEPPEVEHNPGLGDTDIIKIAEQDGVFQEAAGKGPSRI